LQKTTLSLYFAVKEFVTASFDFMSVAESLTLFFLINGGRNKAPYSKRSNKRRKLTSKGGNNNGGHEGTTREMLKGGVPIPVGRLQ